MAERLGQQHERGSESPEQRREHQEQQERLRENVERNAERNKAERPEADVEKRAAERLAESAERAKHEEVKQPERAEVRRDTPATKREREKAHDALLNEAREDMSPASRTFSKVIHNKAVESTSEAVGSTIARPNAILSGSFTAFIVVLAVFLIARHYGYPLSGSETIVAFAGGWVLGILIDYLRILITGRH